MVQRARQGHGVTMACCVRCGLCVLLLLVVVVVVVVVVVAFPSGASAALGLPRSGTPSCAHCGQCEGSRSFPDSPPHRNANRVGSRRGVYSLLRGCVVHGVWTCCFSFDRE